MSTEIVHTESANTGNQRGGWTVAELHRMWETGELPGSGSPTRVADGLGEQRTGDERTLREESEREAD